MENNDPTSNLFAWQYIKRTFLFLKEHINFYTNAMMFFFLPICVVLFIFTKLFIAIIEDFKGDLTVLEELIIQNNIPQSIIDSAPKILFLFIMSLLLKIIFRFVVLEGVSTLLKNEEPLSFMKILNNVLMSMLPILGTLALYYLMLFFGLILFIIPSLIIMVVFAFVPHIIILEKKFFFKAFDKSFLLIKTNILFVLSILLFFFSLEQLAKTLIQKGLAVIFSNEASMALLILIYFSLFFEMFFTMIKDTALLLKLTDIFENKNEPHNLT